MSIGIKQIEWKKVGLFLITAILLTEIGAFTVVMQSKGVKKFKELHPETSDMVICPWCHSTQISLQKKGFSTGKAVLGGLVAVSLGLAAGGTGSKKVERICMRCKRRF